MRTAALLLWLVGCGPGAAGREGAEGATGPAGPPGPPGASAGGYRWHDATGAAVTAGASLVIFDEAGHMWPIDPESAGIGPVAGTFWRYGFSGADCSGTEYAGDLGPPRIVMSGALNDEPERFYVRPDNGALQLVTVASARNAPDDDCYEVDAEVEALPVAELLEVTPPAMSWSGPLHPEPVE